MPSCGVFSLAQVSAAGDPPPELGGGEGSATEHLAQLGLAGCSQVAPTQGVMGPLPAGAGTVPEASQAHTSGSCYLTGRQGPDGKRWGRWCV